MGISFSEVEAQGLLSEEVLECLRPHSICECGSELMFTETLRQVYCENPRCFYKVASRLEAMAVKMEADGWGESTCREICKYFGMISPYQVFLLEDKVLNQGVTISGVSALDKKVRSICDRNKRKYKLWEVVSLGQIPGIDSIARKIFDGYKTIEDAYVDIEEKQVPFIANKLGIKNTESSVMAVNVYNTLIQYKDELIFGQKQFDIYEPEGDTVYVAITGGVYGYRNKSEFIKYISDRYSGKLNPILVNTVTKQVDILIADGDTSSNKFKKANKYNNEYEEYGVINNKFNREEIGTFRNPTDLHPIGELILIGDSQSVIERLDTVYLNRASK